MIRLQLLPPRHRRQAPAPAHPLAAHTLRLRVTRAGVADHLVLILAAVGDHGRRGNGDILLRDRGPAQARRRQNPPAEGVGVTP